MSEAIEWGQGETLFIAVQTAARLLEASGVEEARSNAELLLLHVLQLDRSALLFAWHDPFPQDKRAEWAELLQRKAAGEPIQYMIGSQWFFGREFHVSPSVLIPRPETELLVEAVLAAADELWPQAGAGVGSGAVAGGTGASVGSGAVAGDAGASVGSGEKADGIRAGSNNWERANEAAGADVPDGASVEDKAAGEATVSHGAEASEIGGAGVDAASEDKPAHALSVPMIADIGTGSGAIAVTLAAERHGWQVCASDLSEDALEVARGNAARHGAGRIAFLQGDLLAPLLGEPAQRLEHAGVPVDVLVSNPPYIPAADMEGLQREVRDFEPHLALVGGTDGLDPYRSMLQTLARLEERPRIVAFELGIHQPRVVADMMKQLGCWDDIRIITDYGGIERHIIAVRR
ncbi:N5-glutamine methyltransferase family protein [Paenibacillus sp. IITD108]|uniref:N5-glutamine methyltransferase family protein n=1 Tax=Paenibacillus sp. IITD108 TaxID=3116649 RepID=UPI002F40FF21